MQYKDYYKLMGLERSASQDEIKRSYRKLARKYHPDVSKEADAEERFKEVNEAYEVLKDPDKRAAYDQLGSNWRGGEDFRPPPGWEQQGRRREGHFSEADAAQFSDFFDTLFGGGGARHGRPGRAPFARMDLDQHARVQIALEDAYHGATRSLSLQTPEIDAKGRPQHKTRTLKVRIPAGVTEGQQIRLAGQGGTHGQERGDLYLEISFLPHPLYSAEGRDIYLNLPLTPWEMALGSKVAVPTLGGQVDMAIPPESQPGRKLRLKGRGLPGKPTGDQYVLLQASIPPADTPRARELYEQMQTEIAYNPRRHFGG